jgi:hypothetical protein
MEEPRARLFWAIPEQKPTADVSSRCPLGTNPQLLAQIRINVTTFVLENSRTQSVVSIHNISNKFKLNPEQRRSDTACERIGHALQSVGLTSSSLGLDSLLEVCTLQSRSLLLRQQLLLNVTAAEPSQIETSRLAINRFL